MGSPPSGRHSPADETPSRNAERSETDRVEIDRSGADGSGRGGIDVEFPTHPGLTSAAEPSAERPEPTEPASTRSDANRFVSVVAVDGEVTFAGPSVPAVLGVDRREFRGDDFLAYVHPTERTRVSDALSAVSTERRITHRLRDASGGYRRVVSVVDNELASDLGGRVVTTRRVGVEHDAPESFREFLEYGTDIVTIVGDAGRVRYESPSVEHVLGYEQGSLVGRSPLGYVHPADRDRVTERFYEALADPTCVSALEYRYRTADDDPEPSDGVTVVVDTTADGVVIADDGPGIAVADRSEVFDSGFTTRTHGTGYGLDIVREIVEAHGWRVDIADRDDEFTERLPDGARFEIRAPTPDTADPTAPWIER